VIAPLTLRVVHETISAIDKLGLDAQDRAAIYSNNVLSPLKMHNAG
jgi:hypothetical protein